MWHKRASSLRANPYLSNFSNLRTFCVKHNSNSINNCGVLAHFEEWLCWNELHACHICCKFVFHKACSLFHCNCISQSFYVLPRIREVMPSLVIKTLSNSSLPVKSSAITYRSGLCWRATANIYCSPSSTQQQG